MSLKLLLSVCLCSVSSCYSLTTASPDRSSCPPYYGQLPVIQTRGMTFYIETNQQLTHEEASKFCNRYGMHLADIYNETESCILRDVLRLYGKNNMWISATKESVRSPWFWESGRPVRYFNWRSGEPNNASGNEFCIELDSDETASWNDERCDSRRNFICQKTKWFQQEPFYFENKVTDRSLITESL